MIPSKKLNNKTIIVGLTGGVGSGKSTAQKFCAELNIQTADADDFAHELLNNDNSVINKISDFFVKTHNVNPLLDSGKLDRKLIAKFAFKNKKTLLFLENIIHPIVKKKALSWINSQKNDKSAIAVLIVPLLFESNFNQLVDVTATIAADPEIRKIRLRNFRNWSQEHIDARMKNQLPENQRNNLADYVIDNNGSIDEFKHNFKSFLINLKKDIY